MRSFVSSQGKSSAWLVATDLAHCRYQRSQSQAFDAVALVERMNIRLLAAVVQAGITKQQDRIHHYEHTLSKCIRFQSDN
jgi:hypothetical protein